MKPKLGLVGLGNIGEPVCRKLLDAGYEVLVHDASAEAFARLEDTAAEPAGSLEALATGANVVLLSLPNSDVVEDVVYSGLLGGLSSGKTLIDTSSSRPGSTRTISAKLAGRGVEMLDAPVSGGVLKAREGKLSVMVGGKPEVFDRCLPVFETFGEKVFHVGTSGTGHLLKALNNLLSATTLASVCEAALLAERSGISPETFVEVINASNGRSYSTEVKFPAYVLDRSFDDGFALGLMDKDVGIALEAAAEMDHPMRVGSAVRNLWRDAAEAGYGPQGHTSIFAFLEELSGEHGSEDVRDA